MGNENWICVGPARMHFNKFGNGKKILLAFHGYGQSSDAFRSLEEHMGENYTIYAFDLFFHGNSTWDDENVRFTKEFWKILLSKFLHENTITEFSLLGFSMGSKIVLTTIEHFPDAIKSVILVAPDGINTRFWYSLATYPGVFRKIFRAVITRPEIYFNTVELLGKFKLVDKGILRFSNTQMRTREQRRRVYYSWILYRDLVADLDKVANVLNSENIDFRLYLGKFDKIVTLSQMKAFLKLIKNPEVIILEAGHSNLIPAVDHHLRMSK